MTSDYFYVRMAHAHIHVDKRANKCITITISIAKQETVTSLEPKSLVVVHV